MFSCSPDGADAARKRATKLLRVKVDCPQVSGDGLLRIPDKIAVGVLKKNVSKTRPRLHPCSASRDPPPRIRAVRRARTPVSPLASSSETYILPAATFQYLKYIVPRRGLARPAGHLAPLTVWDPGDASINHPAD